MATHDASMVSSGLEGIIAASTRLSHVDGERGELIIAGYPVAELALNATFEETVALLIGERRRLQTLPLAPEALEAVIDASRQLFGNPSSIHHYGQQAKACVDDARSAVANKAAGSNN